MCTNYSSYIYHSKFIIFVQANIKITTNGITMKFLATVCKLLNLFCYVQGSFKTSVKPVLSAHFVILILRGLGCYFMFQSSQWYSTFFYLLTNTNYLLKFCGTPENMFFADLTNKIGVIWFIHTGWLLLYWLLLFLFDNLMDKKVSGPD